MRLLTKLARLRRPYSSSGSRPKILLIKPAAVERLRELSQGPSPKLIRIGVKSRGCSGLSYDLQYVSSKAKFDEEVVQDGNRSEMDFREDAISSRFTFNNPNIKETCGCGLSFRT